MERPYKVLVMTMWFINLKSALIEKLTINKYRLTLRVQEAIVVDKSE